MRILLLDNIDSFTYNLCHYLEQLEVEVTVGDNVNMQLSAVQDYDKIVLSPGPGLPKEAGKLMEVLDIAITHRIPVLGVCLGMQAIGEYFGAKLFNQAEVKHGRQTIVTHTGTGQLFTGIPSHFKAGLYHSWAVNADLPGSLIATATSEDGILMALEHVSLPVYGVQFHPESILSEYGLEILRNFCFPFMKGD